MSRVVIGIFNRQIRIHDLDIVVRSIEGSAENEASVISTSSPMGAEKMDQFFDASPMYSPWNPFWGSLGSAKWVGTEPLT